MIFDCLANLLIEFKLQYIMGFNNKSHFLNNDQFELLKILHYHQPDTLLKLELFKDLIERLNFIIEKLANI